MAASRLAWRTSGFSVRFFWITSSEAPTMERLLDLAAVRRFFFCTSLICGSEERAHSVPARSAHGHDKQEWSPSMPQALRRSGAVMAELGCACLGGAAHGLGVRCCNLALHPVNAVQPHADPLAEWADSKLWG